MNIIFKSFALLPLGVLGFIPQFYPDGRTWVDAVDTELIQNKVLETIGSGEEVTEAWINLGGPEMVKLCDQKNMPITAVLGTLFLAGELAAAFQTVPSPMATDLKPLCGLTTLMQPLVVNAASQLLFELKKVRGNKRVLLTADYVAKFTPLANLHLVCGSRVADIPSLVQTMIKSATQRKLGTYQSDALKPWGPSFLDLYRAKRVIQDYDKDLLIAGAADTQHLETYFEAMFKPVSDGGLFDQNNGVYFLAPVGLDARDHRGSWKYFTAGRALGLSILYGVPIGRQLDSGLVDLLCYGNSSESMLLEFDSLRLGFRDIVDRRTLLQLAVDTKTVGNILRGMPMDKVTLRMLRAHMRWGFEISELVEFFNALEKDRTYVNRFVQYATGLRHVPVDGLSSIVPPITLRIAPSATEVSVDREKHSVTLPGRDLGNQLIVALKALV